MNRIAKALGLKQTQFNNPHGLADKANHSTAFELCKLASHCIRSSEEFNEIVGTKMHTAMTYLSEEEKTVPF